MKFTRSQIIYALVFTSTGAALVAGQGVIFGFNVTGWAWLLPLLGCSTVGLARMRRVSFPVWIWLPWLTLIWLYCAMSDGSSLQRTLQLSTPIIIGVAASTTRPTPRDSELILTFCKAIGVALWAGLLIKTGILVTGSLPEWTGAPGEVMTASLLCCIFAAGCCFGRRTHLVWWAAMVAVPIAAVTRTAILVAAATLPLTFAPMRFRTRFLALSTAALIGTGIFFSARVQAKMFYSGRGGVADLFGDEMRTNGRFAMWDPFAAAIAQAPILGHGAGESRKYALQLTDNELVYPHNDWLQTAYDYGFVGASCLALTLIVATWHSLRSASRASDGTRIIFFAMASSLPSYALLMITDNIMVYSAYFGNIQFVLLGSCYGALATSHKSSATEYNSGVGVAFASSPIRSPSNMHYD